MDDNDLIKKAEVLEALRYWKYIEGYDKISDLPPAVVRCKDCKYADKFNHCGFVYWWNGPYDFCSKGERKDG